MQIPLEAKTREILRTVRRPMRVSADRLRRVVMRQPIPAVSEADLTEVIDRIVMRILLPQLRACYTQFGREIEAALRAWRSNLGMAQTESDLPADIGYLHTQHLVQVWRRFSRRLASAIAQRIIQGLQQGEPKDRTEQAVAQLIGQALAGYELERIVRTETTRYYNYAVLYETASYPEVVGYRYEVVLDERTSKICQAVAGKTVHRGQAFPVPPLHPNCRTILIPLLADQFEQPTLQPQDIAPRTWLFGAAPQMLKQRLLGQSAPTPTEQFWALWGSYEPSIRRICFSFANGHEVKGQELVSDVMLRAYERYALYDPTRSTFIGWIYRIAKNLASNRYRAEQREVFLPDFDRYTN